MLSYHYVHEELNRRVLRVLHMMLLAYVLPLWIQLCYMGEVQDPAGMLTIWNLTMHPVTITLLVENLVMAGYVLVLEIVQSRVRNFWLYLAAHAVAMAAMWFVLPESSGRIPRLLVCVVFLISAVYARIHETHMGYPAIGWLAVGMLMVMTGARLGLHDLMMSGYVTEIALAVLFALYYNAMSLEQALEHTRGAGGVPYDKVRMTNVIVMLLWLVASSVVIVLLILSGVGEVVLDALAQVGVWMGQQLVRFLGWIVSILPRSDSYEQTVAAAEQIELGTPDAATSLIIIILTAIWETILAFYRLVSVVLIIWLLIKGMQYFYKVFQQAELEQHRLRSSERFTERVFSSRNNRSARLSAFDPTPAARIRRMYLRFLRKGSGFSAVRQSMTPAELLTTSVNSDETSTVFSSDSYHQILYLYEKARYMPARCSLHDVHAMQRAIHDLLSMNY